VKTLKRLTVIHAAIGVAIITITLVMVLLFDENKVKPEMEESMMVVVPLVFVSALAGGTMFYRNTMKNSLDLGMEGKVRKLRIAVVFRDAMMELGGVAGAVGFFLTGESVYLVIPAFMVLMFGLFVPTLQRVGRDLALTDDQLSDFKNNH
jgi:hypothetical protein